MSDLAKFGDYGLTLARGRWIASCYHCRYTSPERHYVGHAEGAVRDHLRDAHHLGRIRRDFRETWGAA